jgi:hypothetical protein
MEHKNTVLELTQISPTSERYYNVQEIAAMWNISKDKVRRIFQNEPGVLILPSRTKGSKRRYTMLRVPHSVLERVHRRCSLVS